MKKFRRILISFLGIFVFGGIGFLSPLKNTNLIVEAAPSPGDFEINPTLSNNYTFTLENGAYDISVNWLYKANEEDGGSVVLTGSDCYSVLDTSCATGYYSCYVDYRDTTGEKFRASLQSYFYITSASLNVYIYDELTPELTINAFNGFTYKFTDERFTSDGYYYTSINSKNDKTGTSYSSTSSNSLYGNLDLYANRTPIPYRFSFLVTKPTNASNNVNFSNTIINCNYDEIVDLPEPTLHGWHFEGWSKTVGGEIINETLPLNLTTTYNDFFSLYANFSPKYNDITFANKVAPNNTLRVYYDNAVSDVEIPTSDGQIFMGYYTQANGLGNKYFDENGEYVSATWTHTDNVTLYPYFIDCHECDDITYDKFFPTHGTITSGNYYLANNTTLDGTVIFDLGDSGEINVCLNGHYLNLNGYYMTSSGTGSINFTDCNDTVEHYFDLLTDPMVLMEYPSVNTVTYYGGVITGASSKLISTDGIDLSFKGISFVGNSMTTNFIECKNGAFDLDSCALHSNGLGSYLISLDNSKPSTIKNCSICYNNSGIIYQSGNSSLTIIETTISNNMCLQDYNVNIQSGSITFGKNVIINENRLYADQGIIYKNLLMKSTVTVGFESNASGKLAIGNTNEAIIPYTYIEMFTCESDEYYLDNLEDNIGVFAAIYSFTQQPSLANGYTAIFECNCASDIIYYWKDGSTVITGKDALSFGTYNKDATLTITAQFTLNGHTKKIVSDAVSYEVYTITFDLNYSGDEATSQEIAKIYGYKDYLNEVPTVSYHRTGYEFLGFGNSADSTSVIYECGDSIYNKSKNETYYAIWQAKKYSINIYGEYVFTVTYDSPVERYEGDIPNNKAIAGYFSMANGEGTLYINSSGNYLFDKYTIDDDLTVYPYYVYNHYYEGIKYNRVLPVAGKVDCGTYFICDELCVDNVFSLQDNLYFEGNGECLVDFNSKALNVNNYSLNCSDSKTEIHLIDSNDLNIFSFSILGYPWKLDDNNYISLDEYRGGVITGATNGIFNLNGCVLYANGINFIGNQSADASVIMAENAIVLLYSSTISGNLSENYGTITLKNSSLTINDCGIIKNVTCDASGAGIFAESSIVEFYGGSIADNVARKINSPGGAGLVLKDSTLEILSNSYIGANTVYLKDEEDPHTSSIYSSNSTVSVSTKLNIIIGVSYLSCDLKFPKSFVKNLILEENDGILVDAGNDKIACAQAGLSITEFPSPTNDFTVSIDTNLPSVSYVWYAYTTSTTTPFITDNSSNTATIPSTMLVEGLTAFSCDVVGTYNSIDYVAHTGLISSGRVTVTFDSSSSDIEDYVMYAFNNQTIKIPTLTTSKTGYKVKAKYYNGTGYDYYSIGDPYTVGTNDLTFNVYSIAKTYTLTLDNSTYGLDNKQISVTYGSLTYNGYSGGIPSIEGKSFVGYYTSPNGQGTAYLYPNSTIMDGIAWNIDVENPVLYAYFLTNAKFRFSSSTFEYGSAITAGTCIPNDPSSFTIEYKTFNADNSTFTTTIPTEPGKYQVRVTREGDSDYGPYSQWEVLEIVPTNISLDLPNASFHYDGDEKEYSISTTLTGFELTYYKEVDFTVPTEYDELTSLPTSVGNYKVVITREADEYYNAYSGTAYFNIGYSATFDLNGGTGTTPVYGNYYYGFIMMPNTEITPQTGLSFIGWRASGLIIKAGAYDYISSDCTYYAQYEVIINEQPSYSNGFTVSTNYSGNDVDYQWYAVTDTALENLTSASLDTSQLSSGGKYYCKVTYQANSVVTDIIEIAQFFIIANMETAKTAYFTYIEVGVSFNLPQIPNLYLSNSKYSTTKYNTRVQQDGTSYLSGSSYTFENDDESYVDRLYIEYDHICNDVTYDIILTTDFTDLSYGYYYLQNDLYLSQDLIISPGSEVNICLDGYAIVFGNYSIIIDESASLIINNCNDTRKHHFTNDYVFKDDATDIDITGGLLTNSNVKMFDFAPHSNLTLNNLNIIGNSNNTDSIIFNNDTLYMNNCCVAHNRSDDTKGIIRNNGYMEVTDCTFTNNIAVNGGAIYNCTDQTLIIYGGHYNDNEVSGDGGVFYNAGDLYISDAEIKGNKAYNGGAIYQTKNSETILQDCEIIDNLAVKYGSAIYCGIIEIYDCLIEENSIEDTSGTLGEDYGGAIYVNVDSVLTIGGEVYIYENEYLDVLVEAGGMIYFAEDNEFSDDSKVFVDYTAYTTDMEPMQFVYASVIGKKQLYSNSTPIGVIYDSDTDAYYQQFESGYQITYHELDIPYSFTTDTNRYGTNQIASLHFDVTCDSSYNATFLGWSETLNPTSMSDVYLSGSTVEMTDNLDLYPVFTTNINLIPSSQIDEYDGEGKEYNSYSLSAQVTGLVVEYKLAEAADSTYTTTAPINPGDYTVKITRPLDLTYSALEMVIENRFTIEKANIQIDLAAQSYHYDGLVHEYQINSELTGFVITIVSGPSNYIDMGNYSLTIHRDADEFYNEYNETASLTIGYSLTFNLGIGEGETPVAEGYYYGTYYLPWPEITVPLGLEFYGWKQQDDFFAESILYEITKDTVLYAAYSPIVIAYPSFANNYTWVLEDDSIAGITYEWYKGSNYLDATLLTNQTSKTLDLSKLTEGGSYFGAVVYNTNHCVSSELVFVTLSIYKPDDLVDSIYVMVVTPYSTITLPLPIYFGCSNEYSCFNTESDYSGTMYNFEDSFTMSSSNESLYLVGSHTCNENTYTSIFDGSSTLNSGYYYLASNVTLTNNVQIEANATVNICLNGYAIIANNYSLIVGNNATLNIYSCDDEREHIYVYSNERYINADGSGGTNYESFYGGCLSNATNQLFVVNQNATLNINNVNIVGNNPESSSLITNNGTINIYDSNIINNYCTNGSTFNNIGTLNITDTTILYNKSDVSGGFAYNSGTINVLRGEIHHNRASDNGGFSYNTGTITIQETESFENYATNGGLVYQVSTAKLYLTDMSIYGNCADGFGGVCYGGSIYVEDTIIENNYAYVYQGTYAEDYGGSAFYLNTGATLIITKENIISVNNYDDILFDGGLIEINATDNTINSSVISISYANYSTTMEPVVFSKPYLSNSGFRYMDVFVCSTGAIGSTGEANISLQFEKGFTVTYSANGGTGTVPTDNKLRASGEFITLPFDHDLTSTGEFVGWSENPYPTSSDDVYDIIKQFDYKVTKDVTLYAIYKRNVTFFAEAFSVEYSNEEVARYLDVLCDDLSYDEFTIYYKLAGSAASTYTTDIPVNVGVYDVKIYRSEDVIYNEYNNEFLNNITITPKEVVIDWGVTTGTYSPTETIFTATYKDIDNKDIALKFTYIDSSPAIIIPAGQNELVAEFANNETNYKLPNNHSQIYTVNQALANEPVVSGTYTYKGNEQTVTLTGVESYMTLTSSLTETNAGTYTIIYTLDDNYTWNEGSDGTITWTIEKATVVAPTSVNSKVYTGKSQTSELANGTLYAVTQATGTNVGEYDVVVTLNDNDNYKWSTGEDTLTRTLKFAITKAQAVITVDQTTITKTYGETVTLPSATTNFGEVNCDTLVSSLVNANTYTVTYTVEGTDNYNGDTKTLTVVINKVKVSVEPEISGTYTYTGNEQTVTLTGVESFMTPSSLKATNAGNHTITISLDDNHEWDKVDGKITWTINKAKANIIVDQTQITKTYGETITLPTATTTFGTVSCNKTAADLVNANTYTVTYTVAGTDNYDGDSKSLSVVINKAKVNEPVVSGTYTYTGSEQTVTLTGVESYMSTTSSLVGTDVGEYTVVYTLDNNHEWAEGFDGTITWNIEKALAEITINATTIVKTYGETVTLPTVTSSFGEVSCDTLASSLVNAGTYTITYSVEATDNYNGDTKTLTVIIEPKEIVIDWSSNSYIYNGNIQVVTATYKDINNETIELDVSYSGKFKEVGNYVASVSFKNNETNYKLPLIFTKNYTINPVTISGEVDGNTIVKFESNKGFEDGTNAKSEIKYTYGQETENLTFMVDYSSLINEDEEVIAIYDIKLLDKNGNEIALNGNEVTVKILIPEELRGKEFSVLHVHSENDITRIETGEELAVGTYIIEGDYIVTKINKLSEFAFIAKKKCHNHYNLFVLLGIVILLLILITKKDKFGLGTLAINLAYGAGIYFSILNVRCDICGVMEVIDIAVFILILFLCIFRRIFFEKNKTNKKIHNKKQKEDKKLIEEVIQEVDNKTEEVKEEKVEETVIKEEPVKEEMIEEKPSQEISLKESIELAKNQKSTLYVSKKAIYDYLDGKYKDVELNNRKNLTETGLPLADTHYRVIDGKKICFAYVYEIDDNSFMILRLPDDSFVNKNKKYDLKKSAFPKQKVNWYTVIISEAFSSNDEIFSLIDEAYNEVSTNNKPSNKEEVVKLEENLEDILKEVSLKESIKIAKKVKSEMTKILIYDHLEKFGTDIELNNRKNLTETGLPLADTHYRIIGDKKICFTYVYELEGSLLLLVRIPDSNYARTLISKYGAKKSAFPKQKVSWYSIAISSKFKSDEEVFDVLDEAYNEAK